MTVSNKVQAGSFAADVLHGLEAEPRNLSSKFFYDARGNALFQQIMNSPEYYLTDCELEIFKSCAPDILAATDGRPFDLIELGAGDGTKTQHLIEQFLAGGANFAYRPIDISGSVLGELGKLISLRWPNLEFDPIEADYFTALDRLGTSLGDRQRLILFPGANIGNLTPADAVDLLRRIQSFMSPGDLLLTGFDLKKDPEIILAAYNDAAGHTAAFNLNLLTRINRELGGNFDLDCWRHWETYNPVSGAAQSFLVATADQEVTIKSINRTFSFPAWTSIRVEISQKYSRRQIEGMADAAGFSFVRHFEDDKGWFADSLWKVPGRR